MIDSHGRNIHYLRISVTDFCNLRCRYCMPADGVAKKNHADILRVEEIERIARTAAGLGIDKIRITGGEPLVRRGIVEICRRIGRIPQIKDLCLTTNGILLGDLAQPIKDAGVNRVNISLDTLNAEKYKEITRVGDIRDVFIGMEAAKKAGLWPIKLNVVLIGGFNDDEIADFVNLTRSEDIEVRFIELMPIGQTAYWEKGNFIAGQEVLNRVPGLVPLPSPRGRHACTSCRVPGGMSG